MPHCHEGFANVVALGEERVGPFRFGLRFAWLFFSFRFSFGSAGRGAVWLDTIGLSNHKVVTFALAAVRLESGLLSRQKRGMLQPVGRDTSGRRDPGAGRASCIRLRHPEL